MAKQITEQVQEYAKSRIEHLLTAHDLAVAEVGAAHRAAAHLRQVEADRRERCQELEAAADERGNAAIREALKAQKKKVCLDSNFEIIYTDHWLLLQLDILL